MADEAVFLGLGTNLGDREANLREAVRLLEERGVRVVQVSSLYETAPVGYPDQPRFLNAVARVEAGVGARGGEPAGAGVAAGAGAGARADGGEVGPAWMLGVAAGIEREMGRVRGIRNGPRVIDIDVLIYGERAVETGELEVPHPRMAERRFVLEPLAEIAPELRHPLLGLTAGQMLARVKDQEAERVAGPEWLGRGAAGDQTGMPMRQSAKPTAWRK